MRPLNGIRVLDLTRVVSGPFCTMLLGDLGADVVKIEEPVNGDDSRAFGPPFSGGESAYFLSVNRNKRSCAINLKSDEGIQLVRQLVRRADVIIDNFRPGTMSRLGLDHDALRAENPRLISCSITGFGQTGVDAQRPGYDLILQGESGIMDITGDPDGLPTKVGTSIADLITGQYASQAIMAALLERSNTGKGHHVDIAMLDCMASLLTFNAGIYFTTGESPRRKGNAHPTIAPYESFQASDGWLNIGVANDKFWQLFCGVIQRPDLASNARYAKAIDR
ncbi:MAG TPA: CoA transferase, partial [Burkholderiaceae bacterium]|nr:CoA transferase [Burkholderiaceae bacterium]